MRALDLCCCAGGATKGLQQAGYHVTGVDIRPQPHYIGDAFLQADALAIDWAGYDLIWASPPCQRYSECTPVTNKDSHPDLLPVFLGRLRNQSTPYICENVEMAAFLLRSPIKLCGSMFGLDFWRHRYFEIGNVDVFFLTQPCDHSFAPVIISGQGTRKGALGRRAAWSPANAQRAAMQIDWMNRDEVSQAIPPAYSKFLAERIQEVAR